MSSDGRSLVAMRRKMRWPSVYIRRYARLHSYSRAELLLPSSLAAQPVPRQEGTSNQAPLFKKRIVAPQAPPPRPAHQVSRQNPAPKVAKLPRPDPGRKAKRSPEISAIASSRHGGNRGRYTISRHTSRLNECLELPICRWAHSGDPWARYHPLFRRESTKYERIVAFRLPLMVDFMLVQARCIEPLMEPPCAGSTVAITS